MSFKLNRKSYIIIWIFSKLRLNSSKRKNDNRTDTNEKSMEIEEDIIIELQ